MVTTTADYLVDDVIDTSALIAYLECEPEAPRIEAALMDADRLLISAATVVEAGTAQV